METPEATSNEPETSEPGAPLTFAIFGATGRTGVPLVEQALAAGHEVRAFARTPEKLPIESARLTVVQGDAQDAAAVERAVAGADAVLSALGHAKGSQEDVQTVATQHIVAAMNAHGVRRLISLTGAGVADPRDAPKLWNRAIQGLMKLVARSVLEDAERHADVIRQSGLDWTIVRAPRLTNGAHTGRYRVGYVGKGTGMTISRADVADFMLRLVREGTHVHEAPMVSH